MRFGGKQGLILAAVAVGLASLADVKTATAQRRDTPYYASISAGQARMRTGPGRNFPATWLYQRRGLPVKVFAIYKEWRKVEDPDGTQGWMQANLLSDRRSAMVVGGEAAMLAAPHPRSRVEWRAAPGVVGRINKCGSGWCWFDVNGRAGYVEISRLWGIDPREEIE